MPCCDGADVVLVHEWTDPALVAAIGRKRAQGGEFTLLFHDTHHRAVSDPDAIFRLDLSGYDAVLAFGNALAEVYRKAGWGDRVFTWHEAADTRLFRPPAQETQRDGMVFIGNWGDDERGEELRSFLLHPAAELKLPLDIYGVRYPDCRVGRAGRRRRASSRLGCQRLRAQRVRPARHDGSRAAAVLRRRSCLASPPFGYSKRWPAAFR